MPVIPTTTNDFVELIRKSSLVESSRLDGYLSDHEASLTAAPRDLATAMVRDGMLTTLQAGLLLRGKWRNFIINNKYKLLEHLGTGGMGHVYLCEHVLMRRLVALKVLPASKAEDPLTRERFYREARAVAALDHPNLVRAHDVDRDGGMHFLVLEYVDGASLYQIVEANGPFSIHRSVHYVRQTADGLQHAHEAGLIHRDIKPSNLLLDRSGMIKILDLGLARFFHDSGDQITRQHDIPSILGTADYLPPEQARDSHAVDIRGDIYSLGVTLYYLLTKSSPFPDGSVSQKLMWHQLHKPISVREKRPDVPAEIAAIIDRMLEKKPEDRFQTPIEVMEALEPFDSVPPGPPAEKEIPRLSRAVEGVVSRSLAGPISSLRRPRSSSSVTSLHLPPLSSAKTNPIPNPAPPVPEQAKRRWLTTAAIGGAIVLAALLGALARGLVTG